MTRDRDHVTTADLRVQYTLAGKAYEAAMEAGEKLTALEHKATEAALYAEIVRRHHETCEHCEYSLDDCQCTGTVVGGDHVLANEWAEERASA